MIETEAVKNKIESIEKVNEGLQTEIQLLKSQQPVRPKQVRDFKNKEQQNKQKEVNEKVEKKTSFR